MFRAGTPQGYRRRLIQRRIDAETLPNLRVAMAEGKLRFHSAQILKGPLSLPATFTIEEVLRGDPEALRQSEDYYGIVGNFWEREAERWPER
jgi:hypothetical protein